MGVLSEDLKNRIRAFIPKYPRKQAAEWTGEGDVR
jgi:hypothetical protein